MKLFAEAMAAARHRGRGGRDDHRRRGRVGSDERRSDGRRPRSPPPRLGSKQEARRTGEGWLRAHGASSVSAVLCTVSSSYRRMCAVSDHRHPARQRDRGQQGFHHAEERRWLQPDLHGRRRDPGELGSRRHRIDQDRQHRECDRRGGEQHRDRDVHQRRLGPRRGRPEVGVQARSALRQRRVVAADSTGDCQEPSRVHRGTGGHTVSMSPHLLGGRRRAEHRRATVRESAFRRVAT